MYASNKRVGMALQGFSASLSRGTRVRSVSDDPTEHIQGTLGLVAADGSGLLRDIGGQSFPDDVGAPDTLAAGEVVKLLQERHG